MLMCRCGTPDIPLEPNHEPTRPLIPPTPRKGKTEVPISQKCLLTLEEAAAYTGIGICKLRELSNDERCDFVLWNGSKRMLKTERLKKYLESAYSI